MSVRILVGSVEAALPALPSATFDAAICDPPYGLSFMGKAWDHGVPGAPIWTMVAAALKPGAPLLAFGGTRTFHRLTCGIEDGGFEIRDVLCWLYGSGFPKSLDVSKAIDAALGAEREVVGDSPWASRKPNGSAGVMSVGLSSTSGCKITSPSTLSARAWSGYGTALKPAWEPCVLAMKPLDGTFAANAMKHGVAGINVDAGRIPGTPYSYPNGPGGCKSSTFHYQDRATTPAESNPLGRWPANVLLDAEAARALDQSVGVLTSGQPAGMRGEKYDRHAYGEWGSVPITGFGDSGGASRFFYTAKADAAGRMGSKHPTLKPFDLCAYLARLILPPKRDTPRRLLVPFSGAGSEIVGALRAGWDEVVGIEREAEYAEDARRRIVADAGLLHSVEVAA